VFCSNACRQAAYRQRRREQQIDADLWEALARMFEGFGDSRNAGAARSRNAFVES